MFQKKEPKPKTKKPGFVQNLMLTGQMTRLIVYIVTIILVTVFMILAVLSLLGILGFGSYFDYFVFALLSGTGVFGMYEWMRVRRIAHIDDIFPDFVRDLAESRRAGMTFTKAILFASRGNYGILTPEIQKISQQVSWGGSVTDALRSFAMRVNTKSIRRTISLIIEASNSGGNVADVLDVAANDAREIKMLEAERRTNMQSYVVVIYVGMFVFLAIVIILLKSFIPAMVGTEGSEGMQGIMGGSGGTSQADITNVFYLACLIQSFGSALVAGVFEDGKFSSSVKHIFIMVFVSWLLFKLVLGV
ncbi:MAG: type II secretion system F family protein [Candidatus Thermoplasmatota archaeon]|nr:type II secretion system F family protein [Candidatus Thermoplasmatota archaeon]